MNNKHPFCSSPAVDIAEAGTQLVAAVAVLHAAGLDMKVAANASE